MGREEREQAEALYAEALAAAARGQELDLGPLCARHPALAPALREVHRDWLRVRGVHLRVDHARPLAERLRERYGADLDPSIVLEPRSQPAGESVAHSVVRRLGAKVSGRSRYEVQGEVARGGMGAVYRVWDPDLRRPLAMKVALNALPGVPHAEDEDGGALPLARFLEEAQITGQLDHPGVVPVHELGIDDDGQVFFTMRLVRGESLERIIERVHGRVAGDEPAVGGRWSLARAVRVLLKICETMAYAHDKGVIHRDLKPANVMVGRFGEVYVMDWGLARVVGRDAPATKRAPDSSATLSFVRTDRGDVRQSGGGSGLETMDGSVLGTPAYMSPQQAAGEVVALDQRADVYALGAILYHLLAGHMPYVRPGERPNAYAVWSRVVQDAPEPLEERAPDAPPELVAICEKAMERSLAARYASVGALSEDLAAFLDGRVVAAYERGALAELRKWVRRNRGTALASAAALVLALGGLGAVSWVQASANAELAAGNRALARANAAEQAATAEAREAQASAERTAGEVRRQRDVADRVIGYLVGLFESPDPARTRGATVTARELLDRGARTIASELDGEPLVRARLMQTMGRAYYELGAFEQAAPLLEDALADRRARLGPEHRETLEAEHALARLERSRGDWQEAGTRLERVLAVEARVLGDEDSLTLETRGELARLERYRGRYDESLALAEDVYAGRRRVFGERHPEALAAALDLARVHRDRDEPEEARALLDRALGLYRATLGDDHPETLRALNELALVEQRGGRLEDAERHLREAAEGRRRVLGEDHPETLWSLADRAHLALLRGRDAEAEELYLDALERHRRVLGEDHPDALALLAGLGGLYQLQDRLEEAEAILAEGVERGRATLGEGHLRTLGCAFGLGAVYFKQGRLEEAEGLYREALAGYRGTLGPAHPQALTMLDDLVRLLEAAGRAGEALPLARELVGHTGAREGARAAREELLARIEAACDAGR